MKKTPFKWSNWEKTLYNTSKFLIASRSIILAYNILNCCNVNVLFVSFLRVKYNELLSNFNELQCEKTAIQQQFKRGSSNVKAIEANMKVWIIQSNVIAHFYVLSSCGFVCFFNYSLHHMNYKFDCTGERGERCEAHKRNSKTRRGKPMFTVRLHFRDMKMFDSE